MSLVGFTLLGSIEAPTITGAATGVPLLVKPNTEFTAAMLLNLDVGGGDLRFSSDAAGLNQLPCEVVDGLDVVWVKPTGVSISTGATLYVWGDNTGASQPADSSTYGRNAVWSGYEFASHSLSSDSTGNAGAPVAVGGVSIGGSTSPIGGATDFDGVNDVVNYGNTASVSTNVSISALVNLDTYGENVGGNLYGRIVRKGGNYDFLSANDTTTTATVILSSARASANSISLGTWLQLDATINSSGDVEFYVNGTSAGSATGYSIGATNSDNLSIGNFDTTNAVGRHTNGKISEVRISQSVKSPSQISIEYDNQSELGSWWIASDATLIEQGFSLLGDIKAPTISGTANNVPMLVKPNTEFTTAMKAALDSSGGDLRFTSDVAGLNQLPIEIVDGLNVVWTLVPSIASNQLVYVWGDNTGTVQPAVGAAFGRNAVWVDYRAVYHLNEAANTTAGGYLDSTGNGYDGTGSNMSEANRTTPAGLSGSGFNGTDESIALPTTIFPTTAQGSYTVSYLAQPDTVAADSMVFSLANTANNDDAIVSWMDAGGTGDGWALNTKNSGVNTTLGVNDNNAQAGRWDYVANIFSPTTAAIRVNNATTASGTITGAIVGRSINAANIGLNVGGSNTYMNGGIAELRLALSSFSDTRLSIEYDNQTQVGSWWIASDVAGGISINESVVNSNYVSLDPAILLTGSISVTESLVNANYAAINPIVTLTGSISITESIVNANYTSLNPVIDLTGIVSVAESLVNSNYISLDPVINLTSGAIEIIESTAGTQYAVFNPSILLTPEPLGIVSTVCFNGELVDLNYSGQSGILEFSGQLETAIFNGEFNALDFSGTIQTTCADGDIKTNC